MHVFLAGPTGVLGRRVLPRLLARGHDVTAMTRRPSCAPRLRALGAETVVVDAYDRDLLRKAMVASRPDVVMHQLTDLSSADTSAHARLRIEGTRNLVDAAQCAGVRRIVAQSVAWAYAPGDEPGRARESVPAFCAAVGAPPPRSLNAHAGRTPWARGADNGRARRELGWVPGHPSWRDGFTDGLTKAAA